MKLTNKAYDILKFIALIATPAIVLFLNTLGTTWGWGDTGIKVSASVAAFGVLLGGFLQVSSSNRNKNIVDGGYLEITGYNEDTGIPDLALTVTEDPNVIAQNKIVQLKVGSAPKRPSVPDQE